MYKLVVSLFIMVFLTACSNTDVSNLYWLEGNWKNRESAETYSAEEWHKTNDGMLVGKGFTLASGDTVFYEDLSIRSMDRDLYYVVQIPERREPVYFKLTQIEDYSFTCENPENDFPKRITYHLKGDSLLAEISDSSRKVKFEFLRRSLQ